MNSARLYLNVTNPLILYSPLVRDKLAVDPEGNGYASSTVSSQGADTATQQRQIAINLNNPPVRQFTFGVNLKF